MNTTNTGRGFSMASVILFCIGVGALAWSADSGSMQVEVTHDNGTPMQDAQVTLYRKSAGIVVGEARTDDGGRVQFAGLEPARDYEVKVTKSEYSTIVIPDIELVVGRMYRLVVTQRSADTPNQILQTAGLGAIRVQVFDKDEKPMKDAQVTLYRKSAGTLVGEKRTGADGLAYFGDLEPVRDYEVKVAKPEYGTIDQRDIEVPSGRRLFVPITIRPANSPMPCTPVRGTRPKSG